MNIHENIATMRKRKGLSQEYVANELDISRVAYGKIERGESAVTFDRLQTLCEIFECSINELINISGVEVQHITGNLNLQSGYDNLVVMSELQHHYNHMLNHLYAIHKEHFTKVILKQVKLKMETFIEHSGYSVEDGFVEDFFAFLQQIDDATDFNDTI